MTNPFARNKNPFEDVMNKCKSISAINRTSSKSYAASYKDFQVKVICEALNNKCIIQHQQYQKLKETRKQNMLKKYYGINQFKLDISTPIQQSQTQQVFQKQNIQPCSSFFYSKANINNFQYQSNINIQQQKSTLSFKRKQRSCSIVSSIQQNPSQINQKQQILYPKHNKQSFQHSKFKTARHDKKDQIKQQQMSKQFCDSLVDQMVEQTPLHPSWQAI